LEKAHRWHFLFTIESLPPSRIEATADQAQPTGGDCNSREPILSNRSTVSGTAAALQRMVSEPTASDAEQ
jgi:hypothetical protein